MATLVVNELKVYLIRGQKTLLNSVMAVPNLNAKGRSCLQVPIPVRRFSISGCHDILVGNPVVPDNFHHCTVGLADVPAPVGNHKEPEAQQGTAQEPTQAEPVVPHWQFVEQQQPP